MAACTPTPEPPRERSEPRVMPGHSLQPRQPGAGAPGARVPGDGCGADRLQHLVGQPAPARFDVPGPVRVVPENGAMTMDHNPGRLTVIVSADGRRRVLSLTCG